MGLLNVVSIGVVLEPICFHKKENAMNFVGIGLHKQTISVCVVSQERKVSARRTFRCCQPDCIRVYFAGLGEFQAVIEATASYEWLWVLLEPLADRIVLAHLGKMRIIAESTRKSDKLDAEVLAAGQMQIANCGLRILIDGYRSVGRSFSGDPQGSAFSTMT